MKETTTKREPLPPSTYACPEYVVGWTIERRKGYVALFDPQGNEVSPNCANGDVRDSFRSFMMGR